jgi:hypothetical protein
MPIEERLELVLDPEMQLAKESVPWKRKGSPGLPSGVGAWGPFVENVGLIPQRLLTDEQLIDSGARSHGRAPLGDLEERSLATFWDYYNNGTIGSRLGSLSYMLFSVVADRPFLRNDREVVIAETVAATLIQWLGTNVGRHFLRQAFWHALEEQKRLQPKVDAHRKFLKSVGELTSSPPGIDRVKRRCLKKKEVKGKK